MAERGDSLNFAKIDGKEVQYSECRELNNPGNSCKDVVYLGKGTYSHSVGGKMPEFPKFRNTRDEL